MGWIAWHSHCVGLQVTERQKAQHPKAQLSPPHLPRKSSLSGSSSYRSTSRSCPGTSYTMNWKEREVTLKHDPGGAQFQVHPRELGNLGRVLPLSVTGELSWKKAVMPSPAP